MIMKKFIIAAVSTASVCMCAAATHYDILGRKNSQMESPMVYKNVGPKQADEQQNVNRSIIATKSNHALARQGINGNNVVAIEGVQDDLIRSDLHNQIVAYTPSGIVRRVRQLAPEEYISIANNYFTQVQDREASSSSYTSAKRTNSPDYTVTFPINSMSSDHTQASPYEYGATTTYSTLSYVQNRSKKGAVSWYFNGDAYDSPDIGVYIFNDDLPAKASYNGDYSFIPLDDCAMNSVIGYEVIASKTAHILNRASMHSKIFAHNARCNTEYPSSPELESPQIYMGLHTRKATIDGGNNSSTAVYSSTAKKLDNYIYNNHTVEIVGAGNFGTHPRKDAVQEGKLAAEAHAANAITVGAVNPLTKKYENYSSWKNTAYGAKKPEVANYTNIYFNETAKKYTTSSSNTYIYQPYYDGTETAAAYTAAMVSELLSLEPFYRWHPEVVKALLLTAGDETIVNTNHDTDQGASQILSYRTILGTNYYRNQSRYWIGDINRLATNKTTNGITKKEIKFNVEVTAGATYKAAIAWLSSGDDIAKYGRIPQDFDLYVYKNYNATSYFEDAIGKKPSHISDMYRLYTTNYNNDDLITHAQNEGKNPYEVLQFTADQTGLVTFSIILYEDRGETNKDKVILGFNVLEID